MPVLRRCQIRFRTLQRLNVRVPAGFFQAKKKQTDLTDKPLTNNCNPTNEASAAAEAFLGSQPGKYEDDRTIKAGLPAWPETENQISLHELCL